MVEKHPKLLRTVEVFPPERPMQEIEVDMVSHLESGQRLERDNRSREYVVKEINDARPRQIIVISDWHLGNVVADIKEMDAMRDYVLSNPDVMVIFAGDEVEGWSGGKYSQSIDAKTKLDAEQQIQLLRYRYLKPLADAGRVLGMVSEYWGHPGWLSEKTKNAWRDMVVGLDIDLIQNGGYLILKYPSQKEDDAHFIKVWHNPPGAGKWDELSGQREVMLGTSESSRPDGSVAGHIHSMQVAEEVYAGAKRKVYYISAGTLKGTNPNLSSDLFGTYLGRNRPDPQGQGVTSIPRRGRREEMNIPFANLKQAGVMIDAVRKLDRIEQLGMRDEWLEKIYREIEAAPILEYPLGSNRLGERYKEERPPRNVNIGGESIKNPYSNMEMKAPYSVLSVDVKTQLPVAVELIANARMGSSLEGYKDLKGFLGEVANNPHRLVLFLRNMIDREAGRLPHRIEVLDKFVDLIGRSPEEGVNYQTIAIMMCESMRQDAWKTKKDTGEVEEYEDYNGNIKYRKIYTPPVAPGSYIASATEIPLIHHLSLLKLSVGPGSNKKTIYPIVAADKAENSGSGTKPEWGLQVLYDKFIHEKPGMVVGTHMANAGAATIFDRSNAYTHYPSLIAPGWWAGAADSMGKGNVKKGAEPGQAVILMPGDIQAQYEAYPAVSREEAKYTLDALTLLKGLEIMEVKRPGITKKVLGRK